MESNLKGKCLHLSLKDVKDETRNRDLNELFRSIIIQTNKKYDALPKIRQAYERETRRI